MAKAKPKPSEQAPEPVRAVKSKAKVGPVSRELLAEGIEKLEKSVAQLRAMSELMKQYGKEELTLEGPKLLPRGVNSVLQFVLKLDGAIRRLDRM